jgi:hypothetical protein
MSVPSAHESERELSTSERELLKELALAVREIRYGSVVLTIHDGRVVEWVQLASNKLVAYLLPDETSYRRNSTPSFRRYVTVAAKPPGTPH